ncbi:MAG: UDP-N-acetylglucosamine--N-acetylmuramyl-(pentapeptide) pyrophosphoryl-undecaprenol N-acetylglucosamine transferase [Candidatus Pacebacteria bacterium]|nr:UDP-N-acetylglucosamine--N-acetylmuramyl-(pentapeptide) pyrophosphoryl-undecaprenol N-acetylglucosamine transferase [Candidatus Paceibacterota bacterium]
MKVVFTGGGSGGHFYPIIAVAQELRLLLESEGVKDVVFFFMSDDPYDQKLLDENNITFVQNKTGKLRLYFSLQNFLDIFSTFFGIIRAFVRLYKLYPDVVFSKGAYPSFPVTFAARLLRIPVIIHESDSVPGRANKMAASYAKKIAISFPGAADFFPPDKVALTGNPIRKELFSPITDGAREVFGLEEGIPTIFIIGGSQGAQRINDMLISAGPELIDSYQIIHQIGENNINTFKATMDIIIEKHEHKNRYKMLPYLDLERMRMVAGVADMVVSRGGSTIFEIAAWGKPSIIIPISKTNGDHQRKNAYAYARVGACEVMEENNLTAKLFIDEIDRIFADTELMTSMSSSARSFSKDNAALKISREIVSILKEHSSYGKEKTK